ncbi:MAG: L,D-transpeptidase [Bacteroidales bacterium]|nr:L,D-transpeptidase [Bacteroidales bacterium]
MKTILLILSIIIPLFASSQVMREPSLQMQSTLQRIAAIQSPVNDRTVYGQAYCRDSLYINISKPIRTLFVYERRCTGNVLIAAYPVCLGANSGNKRKSGDMRTPETVNGRPFLICQITNASRWHHDFRDGRGPMPAYGHWFLRLKGNYPGSGIGIHGSTSNRYSVPGRGSEGCIRLRDEDIIHLKENYAFVGMKVFIEKDL